MQNVTQFLDKNISIYSEKVLTFEESSLSFTFIEILKEMSKIAQMLSECGFSKGDRVLIYLNNCPEYFFSYIAVWRLAGIVIPANRILTTPEVLYMLGQAKAKFIITDRAGKETIEQAALDFSDLYIFTDDDIKKHAFSGITPPVLCSPDTVCQIQYTSGTTGRPKGAMLTHGGWTHALKNAGNILSLRQGDIYLGIYPMAHVGLVWGFAALMFCSRFIEMEKYSFNDYVRLIEKYNVTIAASMPPVFHSFVSFAQKSAPCDLSELKNKMASVRGMISGGGVLHHEIWKPFYETFRIPVYNAYGLSETIVVGTGACIVPNDYPFADRFQSVGYPTAGTELKIVDSNDPNLNLSRGEIGEVCLRGPSVASGYWDMPEESAETFLKDGWFLTGDMGFIDRDGRLTIVDRKKEMIVMSGWKVYPTEVESVLLNHPYVSEAAVFAVSDPHRYEIPVAALILNEKNINPDVYRACNSFEADSAKQEDTKQYQHICKELESYCRQNLAAYKIPRRFYFRTSFPRVNGWKLLRRELRLLYEN